MKRFTKGVWHHEASDRGNHYTVRLIAPHCTGVGELIATRIEHTDDARLISSAPKLYNHLLSFVESRNCLLARIDEKAWLEEAKAILAEIDGENL